MGHSFTVPTYGECSRAHAIVRSMRQRRFILVLAFCSLTFSCARQQSAPSEQPATAAASPTSVPQAEGGLATSEPGEIVQAEFKGSTDVIERKKNGKLVVLKEVRAGRHLNFDRVVFEFEGDVVPGYRVEYLEKPAKDCGAGEVVKISGDRFLLIAIQPAQAHTESGVSTVRKRHQTPGYPVIKEMKLICDFEAHLEWLMGVGWPSRYRVLELSSPARLVVDVAH